MAHRPTAITGVCSPYSRSSPSTVARAAAVIGPVNSNASASAGLTAHASSGAASTVAMISRSHAPHEPLLMRKIRIMISSSPFAG